MLEDKIKYRLKLFHHNGWYGRYISTVRRIKRLPEIGEEVQYKGVKYKVTTRKTPLFDYHKYDILPTIWAFPINKFP